MSGAPGRARRRSRLVDIWYFVATESGSPEVADRFLDRLTESFGLLADTLRIGRRGDDDLLPGMRSFPVGRYVILYRVMPNNDVRVIPGMRDIPSLLR